MIKRKKLILYIICFYLILFTNNNNAQEILIYADDISYDKDENIVAKGNAKIFKDNQFILSDLIIYDKINEKIFVPSSFILKDENNNYFQGTDGYFEKSLNYGSFNNVKIRLNDGSRIIGIKGKKDGNVVISLPIQTRMDGCCLQARHLFAR